MPRVNKVFTEAGIGTESLPPKMTDRLQVMGPVANGPRKLWVRRKRTKALYDYFQKWKT